MNALRVDAWLINLGHANATANYEHPLPTRALNFATPAVIIRIFRSNRNVKTTSVVPVTCVSIVDTRLGRLVNDCRWRATSAVEEHTLCVRKEGRRGGGR